MARQEPLSPESILQGNAAGSLPNPGAAADWTFTNPASGNDLLVVSARAKLVTSANAANRIPTFEVQDGAGNKLFDTAGTTIQTATLTVVYSLAAGFPGQAATANGLAVLGIPERLVLRPGWKLLVVTTALAAGDQWSEVALNVMRF